MRYTVCWILSFVCVLNMGLTFVSKLSIIKGFVMKLDIFESQYHSREETLTATAEDLEIGPIEGVVSFGDFVLNCKVNRNDDIATVRCKLSVNIDFECSRCLEKFSREMLDDFTVVARKMKRGEASEDFSSEDSEETSYILLDDDTNDIELAPFVRDAFMLDMPMKVVCDDECKGLCSSCGANLNTESCDCHASHVDERWKDLQSLLGSGKTNKKSNN